MFGTSARTLPRCICAISQVTGKAHIEVRQAEVRHRRLGDIEFARSEFERADQRALLVATGDDRGGKASLRLRPKPKRPSKSENFTASLAVLVSRRESEPQSGHGFRWAVSPPLDSSVMHPHSLPTAYCFMNSGSIAPPPHRLPVTNERG
jgi:hypothetical protein